MRRQLSRTIGMGKAQSSSGRAALPRLTFRKVLLLYRKYTHRSDEL